MSALGRRFEDKVVLVTGGAGAIGSAAARRFAAEGARLVILDRNREGRRRLPTSSSKAGTQALAVTADVGSESEVDRAVAEAVDHFGRLDVLFNNAGIAGKVAPVHELCGRGLGTRSSASISAASSSSSARRSAR